MKKNVIALLLTVVMVSSSVGTVPVLAAETVEQEEVSEEKETVEDAADTEDADTGETVNEATEGQSTEIIEEEPGQGATEAAEEAETTEEAESVEDEEKTDSADIADTSAETAAVEEPAEDVEEVEEDETKQEALAEAGNVVDSGTCGENATWTLTGEKYDYTLTISGTGDMYDYDNTSDVSPWSTYKDDIYNVVVEEGITSIGSAAFYDNRKIVNVLLPESLTVINSHAFYRCYDLTTINIPNSLEYIGQYSFSQCEDLCIELDLPNSIADIGEYAFSGCSSITGVELPCNLDSIKNGVFQYCTKLTSAEIPNSVISIGDNAFRGTGIKELNIPNTVVSLGTWAFGGSAVESVLISDSVNSIGDYCFSGCSYLKTISLPNGITEIKQGTFNECQSLKSIEIPNGVTSIGHSSIPYSMVYIKIPDSVTHISGYNFSSEKTNILYYGTEKQWNKVENSSPYHNLYCITNPVTGIDIGRTEYVVGISNKLNIIPQIYPQDASCDLMEWEVEDDNIASVYYYDGAYRVTGMKEGSTVFRCRTIDGGFSTSCTIKVTSKAVTGIEKEFDDEISVGIGRSTKLSAHVIPKNSENQNINWSTSDSSIVNVDGEGNITGVGVGSATITATSEDGLKSALCNVTSYIPVSEIIPSNDSIVLTKGAQEKVYVTVKPDDADAAHRKLKWDTTIKDIVTVAHFYDQDTGVQGCFILARKGGQTRVVASSEDGFVKEYIDVTVIVPVQRVQITKASESLHIGDKKTLQAEVYPSDATNKNIVWSSSNEEVATVDENGEVTALNLGETTISVVTEDGGYSSTCDVSVIVPVTGIELNKTSISMHENETEALSAVVLPEDAGDKSLVWSSSDNNTARVDQQGIITAVNAGTASIIATTNDGGYSASCEVTVHHVWNEDYTVDKEATCTEEGSESIHCSVCDTTDETTVRSIPKKEHAYGDWTVTKEPTCTEIGSKEKVCEDCGDKVIEEVPATGHVWNGDYTVDKESTCTEEGTESIHCSVCNVIDETSIRSIPKKDHEYGDWTITKEANCTEAGSKEKVCSNCGDKVTEEIPAIGHIWKEEFTVDKEATCSEEGSESIHCAVCGETDESTIRVIPKKEHVYGAWSVIKAATCTEEGRKEKECTACGDKVTEVILANGHTWNSGYIVDKPSTCAEEGSKSIHCSICDAIDETTVQVIPKKEHVYGDWTVTKEATCTEVGSKEKVCANCGDKITEEIPATGHSYGDWTVTKEATCTEGGSKEKVCANCGDKITEEIPAAGHQWNESYTIDVDPTYTEEGVESIHCSVCEEIKEGSERAVAKLRKPVSMLEISGIVDKNYNGKAQTQAVVVMDGDTTLVNGTDYTVSYKSNTNAGTASVIITGIGSYTGSVTKEFTIKKIANTITAKSFTRTYSTKAQSFDLGVKIKSGTPTYKSSSSSVTVSKAGKVTVKAKFMGKVTITITAPANTNYTATTKKITITVNPTKTALVSVTSPSAGKMAVKWKKNAAGTGYQIQYSTSSKFTSPKSVTITKNSTLTRTIGSLAKGKKYYVRIRTYKTVGSTKFYSGWSAAKAVTVKK